ncbi:hypothetical protein B0H10DRAFT_1978168 [Mycena sp. CBHHK59/15]|nr:hypothetical protein B0H10DRAFT_1978168 [Mycena sp. CBHHK59/15]
MLDHYYTPRDPVPLPLSLSPAGADAVMGSNISNSGAALSDTVLGSALSDTVSVFARVPRTAPQLVDLVFDCDDDDDDDSDSGSDDGYVSVILRALVRPAPPPPGPRRIAGARRVARAVTAPFPQVPVQGFPEAAAGAPLASPFPQVATGVAEAAPQLGWAARDSLPTWTPTQPATSTWGPTWTPAPPAAASPREELFQSITATPGLRGSSFEELRLETYRQSLIATGSARPPDARFGAGIPPAFRPHTHVAPRGNINSTDADVGMEDDVHMSDA